MPGTALLEEHDRLHADDGDPDWFEAFWFGFFVPGIDLTVYVYPWFRTALGLWGGGVLAWDGSGSEPWTMRHNDYRWSERLGDPAALIHGSRLVMPQGIVIDCLAPGRDYAIRYESAALELDVVFTAARDVNITTHPVGASQLFAGHIDQPGHYRGRVRLDDVWHDVDCHWVRDRSWGLRRNDNLGMHVGYYHATASADDAFLIVTDARASPDRSTLITGYLIREGIHAALASGGAALVRQEAGSPARCTIDAEDVLGRSLHATGTSRTKLAYQLQPGMFNWSTLARWRFGDVEADGELQDTWHPDAYRAFIRNLHP